MNKAYIKDISVYVPKNEVANTHLASLFPEWEAQKIFQKIGIENRYVTDDKEFTSDMAVKAVTQLLNQGSIEKDHIDFILLCTQSPDHFLPTTACIVQDRLGLPTHCGALDFNLGCSGYIYGLSLAKGLIYSNTAKNVVLITSEVYSKHIHPKDKGNRSLFGDAATATLISTEGRYEIQNFSLGTDGKGADNLMVKRGGVKYEKTAECAEPGENNLYMNGPAIFNFTSKAVPSLVDDNLEKNHLKKDDVAYIFHQANLYMLEYLRKRIGISKDRFFTNMKYGNTVSSTIPIALSEAIDEIIKNNILNIMLVGFGVGYSWGAVTIKRMS